MKKLMIFFVAFFFPLVFMITGCEKDNSTPTGVNPPPDDSTTVIINFSAIPKDINAGDSTNLIWTTKHATSCSLVIENGDTVKNVGTNGNHPTKRLYKNATYVLIAYGKGFITKTLIVSVAVVTPPPETDLQKLRKGSWQLGRTDTTTLGANKWAECSYNPCFLDDTTVYDASWMFWTHQGTLWCVLEGPEIYDSGPYDFYKVGDTTFLKLGTGQYANIEKVLKITNDTLVTYRYVSKGDGVIPMEQIDTYHHPIHKNRNK
jgi:hypothetical protein